MTGQLPNGRLCAGPSTPAPISTTSAPWSFHRMPLRAASAALQGGTWHRHRHHHGPGRHQQAAAGNIFGSRVSCFVADSDGRCREAARTRHNPLHPGHAQGGRPIPATASSSSATPRRPSSSCCDWCGKKDCDRTWSSDCRSDSSAPRKARRNCCTAAARHAIPFITNRGRKGGSNVAAAVMNALLILALIEDEDSRIH